MADDDRIGVIKGIKLNYRMTKQVQPKIPLILLGTFLGVGVVWFALFYLLTGGLWLPIISAVLTGLVGVLIVLARQSQKAMYTQLEGTMGASARALMMLRKGWKVSDQPVAFNKNQDFVHRVIGRPGVILVGEGNPNRVKPLLQSEKKRHERVVGDTVVHTIIVGDGPGEVTLRKLTRHVMKLPKTTRPAEVTDIQSRLRALDAMGRNMPIPKGPVPTNMKGMRGNMRGR